MSVIQTRVTNMCRFDTRQEGAEILEMKTEHLVVCTERVTQTHTFSRVAHMSQIVKRTCFWLKICGLFCPACVSKVIRSSHVAGNIA